MAKIVYIDETGSVGKGASQQPLLTLVAVMVDEGMVRQLGDAVRQLAWDYLGVSPGQDFELHGVDIWGGEGHWHKLKGNYAQLMAAYEEAIGLLAVFEMSVMYASIHKARLHSRYDGNADANAYRLALQFLLEKVDAYGSDNKIIVADEAADEHLPAIKMLADLQSWGGGMVPGKKLKTVIDSLHFVQSQASPGVQMADIVAWVIQRSQRGGEKHANAAAALGRLTAAVNDARVTWRQPWPPA